MTTDLTEGPLAEIREAGRAAARAKLSGGTLPTALAQAIADEVADAVLDAALPMPLAEIDKLRAEAAKEERAHLATIDERDHAQDMADQLAYTIAPMEVIGEHSSDNCPWTNAVEEAHALHAKAKEVGKELEDTALMRDFNQRSAEHVMGKRDRAEQLIGSWERGDMPACDALLAIKAALAVGPLATSEESAR